MSAVHADGDDFIDAQYAYRRCATPIYDALIKNVARFGDDIEVSPTEGAVSLRARSSLRILHPISGARLEGLNLKTLWRPPLESRDRGQHGVASVRIGDFKEVDPEFRVLEAYESS